MTRLVCLCLLACPLLAQDSKPLDAEPALKKARERLKQLGDSKTEENSSWWEAVEGRIQLLEEFIGTGKERAGLTPPGEIKTRKQKVEKDLEAQRKATAPKEVTLEKPEDLEPYDEELKKERATQTRVGGTLDGLRRWQTSAEKEQKDLPARESNARNLLEKLTGSDDVTKYRAKSAAIELQVIAARRQFLKEGRELNGAAIPVLELEADLARLRVDHGQRVYDLAHASAARLREIAAEAAKKKAEADKKAAELERDPVERFRKRTAADATRAQSDASALQNALDNVDREIEERKQANDFVRNERKSLENRLRLRGDQTTRLLQRVLSRARRSQEIYKDVTLPKHQAAVELYQGELVDCLDRLWELQLPSGENPVLDPLLDDLPESRHQEARQAFVEGMEGKDGLIPALRATCNILERIDAKRGQLAALHDEYTKELDALTQFVLVRIYWVASDPPFRIDPAASWEEIKQIWGVVAGPGVWSRAGTVKSTVVWSGLLALVLSFVLGARLRRSLMPAAEASFGRALVALLVAILPAAIFFVVAQVIDSLQLPEQLDPPVPRMLRWIALMMFVQRTAVWLLAEHGAAVRFFKQNVNVTKQVLRSIKIATYGAILLKIPSVVLRDDPFELARLPRILETAWDIAVGLALFLLLSRRGALIQSITRPNGFPRRLWGIVHPGVALVLLGIIAMDIAGYRVGAHYLMLNTSRTLIALLLLGGLYTGLVPFIRMAADRVWRTTLKEEGAEAARESSSALTEQLTRLVAFVLTAIALVALFHFWGFADTVVHSLEGIRLAEIDDGGRWLSLWDVFVAVFWVIGGHLIVHNLASLYEYVVFPIIGGTDKGGRFVLLTLSRYIILVVAYGTAIVTLGFNLQSLGWLFAALSVGLGFGLQEIVANFFSGLILLFERPVRVGDIITVGDTGGTVEKINIRATTVTNWDRQTIVIPNKNFITQNLTNWTHNDQIMRAVVKVGVAYGSDVEKVLHVLDEIAGGHPKVLRDPPHRIWFKGFGDSSLDFLVWCFTRIEDRLKTASELRVQIYVRFKEEGIEIPLPQTDLHIRTRPDDAALGALLKKRKED